MKIQGMVEVEGVTLRVDIDAPDGQDTIYVTNMHPNCLLIPKERFSIEFLGLSAAAQKELKAKQIKNLGQLTNGTWELSKKRLTKQTAQAVTRALTKLQQAALMFEERSVEEIAEDMVGFPIEPIKEGDKEHKNIKSRTPMPEEAMLPLTAPLKQLKISQKIADFLLVVHKAKTLADVLALGRRKIAMTPGISHRDVEQLEERLAQIGHQLPEAPQDQSEEAQEAGDGTHQ